MNCLEISNIGSACGKNVYNPRIKTILLLLCREKPEFYKKELIKNGNIIPLEGASLKKPIEKCYKTYSKKIKDPNDFENIENEVIEEIKTNNPSFTHSDITFAKQVIKDSLKKDCGKNTEHIVIEKSNYKKGNNVMLNYKDPNHKWKLKGFHDASNGDLVIEIKTRMRQCNVKKNEYDLYQLFGYMLAMNKTRGMITQTYDNKIYDSTVETQNEYGIVDITEASWNEKYIDFYKELSSFFEEVKCYHEKMDFDVTKVLVPGKIYAHEDSRGNFHNINPDFTNLFKAFGK